MLTERESSGGGEEEVLPPFLLETTEFVRPPTPRPSRVDGILDTLQRRRPPFELLALFGLVGALVVLYLQRPGGEAEPTDPLAASPPAASVVVGEPSTSTTAGGAALVGDPGNLSASVDDPAPVRTLPVPSTTAAPTTRATRRTTTTEEVTTTISTTTTTAETTTTTAETTTTTEATTTTTDDDGLTRLDDCVLVLRNNTPVFAQPTGQNPLGRVPGGDYRATATTGNWYQIEAGQARGWVREGRVRDTKGDCD